MSEAIVVGDWVVAGAGETADFGHILRWENEDASLAFVAWQSGVSTTCDLSADGVDVFGRRAAAEKEYESRS